MSFGNGQRLSGADIQRAVQGLGNEEFASRMASEQAGYAPTLTGPQIQSAMDPINQQNQKLSGGRKGLLGPAPGSVQQFGQAMMMRPPSAGAPLPTQDPFLQQTMQGLIDLQNQSRANKQAAAKMFFGG